MDSVERCGVVFCVYVSVGLMVRVGGNILLVELLVLDMYAFSALKRALFNSLLL